MRPPIASSDTAAPRVDLARGADGTLVVRLAPHSGVRITLQQFEATAADSALLAGRWEIVDRAGAVVARPGPATYRGGAAAGPKGGAFALSELLARLSADIAGALRNLPGGS